MGSQNIEIYRDRLIDGFDGITCRIIPAITLGKSHAFMINQILSLTGADVFLGHEISRSTDGGEKFEKPQKLNDVEYIENGIRTIFGIDVMLYHPQTDKWLCFGRTTHYEHDKHPVLINGISTCEAYYAVFDPDLMQIGDILPLPVPFESISAVPHGQPIIDCNGNILLTLYGTTLEDTRSRIVSVLYSYDGEQIKIIRSGSPLVSGSEHTRGYCEPSLACLNGKYYITIRTDEAALLATSENGLDFSKPFPWRFDNGETVESINTQQRWVRFKDKLYLAYTRKTQYNSHIFRNRAPLFIAEFDEDKLCLLRDSERILVPELGARLGNFQVTDVNDNEAWVTVAEWMQYGGKPDEWQQCAKYGSNNTLWRARVIRKETEQ
jgi:hypothetical protein